MSAHSDINQLNLSCAAWSDKRLKCAKSGTKKIRLSFIPDPRKSCSCVSQINIALLGKLADAGIEPLTSQSWGCNATTLSAPRFYLFRYNCHRLKYLNIGIIASTIRDQSLWEVTYFNLYIEEKGTWKICLLRIWIPVLHHLNHYWHALPLGNCWL